MKINNSAPPTPIQIGARPEAANTRTNQGADTPAAAASSVVGQLGTSLADTTHDIDGLRVEEVRQAIIDGRLEIDAGKIADGLLENLKGK